MCEGILQLSDLGFLLEIVLLHLAVLSFCNIMALASRAESRRVEELTYVTLHAFVLVVQFPSSTDPPLFLMAEVYSGLALRCSAWLVVVCNYRLVLDRLGVPEGDRMGRALVVEAARGSVLGLDLGPDQERVVTGHCLACAAVASVVAYHGRGRLPVPCCLADCPGGCCLDVGMREAVVASATSSCSEGY